MAARKGMSGVVRRICLWCQGKSWMRVRECAQTSCPLHSCRLLEDGEGAALLECVRNFCLACAGSPEAVNECCADSHMGGQPACPAYPYRNAQAAAVCSQPLISQQVRLLPGLGDICAPKPEPSATSAAGEQGLLAGPQRSVPSAPSASGPDALSITFAERAPEAPDI